MASRRAIPAQSCEVYVVRRLQKFTYGRRDRDLGPSGGFHGTSLGMSAMCVTQVRRGCPPAVTSADRSSALSLSHPAAACGVDGEGAVAAECGHEAARAGQL